MQLFNIACLISVASAAAVAGNDWKDWKKQCPTCPAPVTVTATYTEYKKEYVKYPVTEYQKEYVTKYEKEYVTKYEPKYVTAYATQYVTVSLPLPLLPSAVTDFTQVEKYKECPKQTGWKDWSG